MDKLDIYELPKETKVIVTIKELRKLYAIGRSDDYCDEIACDSPLVKGELVG